jgi:hypothetical protein
MDLEQTLESALYNMLESESYPGHQTPHCFSANVPGKGYVNDGSEVYDRVDYLRQLASAVRSEIDNMGYAEDYVEPGYIAPKNGILFANWNVFPSGIDYNLELLGFCTEWSDEWAICECNRAYRTSPDSYDWAPAFVVIKDRVLCIDCAKELTCDE